MAIDAETFRWCVGGYFSAMAVVTGVAYHDPKFFLSWAFNKLTGAAIVVYVVVCSFWVGAKVIKDYVINKLSVPSGQLEGFMKSYESGTDTVKLLVIGCVITFFWCLALHSLSVARNKN